MFTPWIKRSALKKASKGKRLVVGGESPSMVILLSLSTLLVLVGVFVVQHSRADSLDQMYASPTPSPTMVASPTSSASLAP